MKKIYFVQANISCTDVRSYLPYAVGCLIAYAWQFDEIASAYEAADIFFLREKPEEIMEKLDEPFMVAFSCGTWNMEYNRVLSGAIRKRYPACRILFGGHSITNRPELFREDPFVDYFLYGEGEEPFYSLLLALDGKLPLEKVPNLLYRCGEEENSTFTAAAPCIENYPSPYCAGVFDRLIEQHPEIEFNITMETSRGCPYGCTYCDWSCSKQVRFFSLERVKAEIDWMAAHKTTYCMPGDANFGIADRDVGIARYVADTYRKTGYPQIFKPCYAKFNDDNVFQAGLILNSTGIDKGVTVSCQSLSEEVLRCIDRQNISPGRFKALVKRFRDENISTYTELIVGLPGETLESFCRGLCETIEYGQNNSMSVYMCYVFPGSPMYSEAYKKKYGIKTVRMPINTAHYSPDFNGIPEYYDVVVETAAMPFYDWVQANMFAFTVQCFHHMGLLRFIAAYLHREKGIGYYTFYHSLYTYLCSQPQSVAGSYLADVGKKLMDTSGNWTFKDGRFSDIGWFFEEGLFLHTAYSLDTFFKDIEPFIASFNIDGELLTALVSYQKDVIRLPGADEKTIRCSYSFYDYFAGSDDSFPALQKKDETLHVHFRKHIPDWKTYAVDIVWFGKRNSETLIINPREALTRSE